MYRIDLNKVITMVRGDSFSYDYEINIGNNIHDIPYKMVEGDFLYFALCEPNQVFEEATVWKKYDYTDCIEKEVENQFKEKETRYFVTIRLSSDDTIDLKEGKYYYTIKLVKDKDSGFDVITTQPKTLFFLV